MPELPEVETVRRMLIDTVVPKEIVKVEVYYEKIVDGDAADFAKRLTGQSFESIDRKGKFLIFILSQDAFISHLRMEGKYELVDAAFPRDKHEHLSFFLEDGTRLRYLDVRKFGRVKLVDKQDYLKEPSLMKLGPEPWDITSDYFYQRIHRSEKPIKSLLLDQSVIAGLGNIYANEVCFRVGLSPKTPGKKLSKKKAEEILEASKTILTEAIRYKGTTIHTFSSNGESGGYQDHLLVHGQKNCPTCGRELTKEAVGGRGTYYCKNCQK
ncbi:DNA-formamidopyrimidine glycosylase [Ohessyouella blattaphilus]|uniref:Formamidopyrimidine-DNA glycosylase n=1 Tax=Ohessyouella blattaphilus TaxID=2949333 RepID=A0ABT1EKA0_9FIRM|nr:DNA-formamidopyrimidine glycosylase [Ohessyouella blattaphilus]MCP1110187.1 DNA-formamidopyrimidine glycosylase [Ohessyouella blattaphilus]MCR8563581.1 DNA-formamidopyrimidine glycosylase [Ohessyouella blattaphilus]